MRKRLEALKFRKVLIETTSGVRLYGKIVDIKEDIVILQNIDDSKSTLSGMRTAIISISSIEILGEF